MSSSVTLSKPPTFVGERPFSALPATLVWELREREDPQQMVGFREYHQEL